MNPFPITAITSNSTLTLAKADWIVGQQVSVAAASLQKESVWRTSSQLQWNSVISRARQVPTEATQLKQGLDQKTMKT